VTIEITLLVRAHFVGTDPEGKSAGRTAVDG
jgi:hypothetical protein